MIFYIFAQRRSYTKDDMNIETRKIILAQQLLSIQQEAILDKIEDILQGKASSVTYEQKDAIDKGLISLDEGKRIPHEHVMEHMKEQHPKYFK